MFYIRIGLDSNAQNSLEEDSDEFAMTEGREFNRQVIEPRKKLKLDKDIPVFNKAKPEE